MANSKRRFRLAVTTVVVVVLSVLTAGTAAAARPTGGRPAPIGPPAAATRHMDVPQKVLLYGDSITMGSAGHWTWRYRLWQGLQAAGTSVQFVGPLHTVWTYKSSDMSSMEYRNPSFDTSHAAYAGMTLAHPVWTMAEMAAKYRPDVLVGLIGFNDLWWGATPQQVVGLWRQQIELARKADPGVVIVLGQYGQTWVPGVSDFNTGLADLAREMDRPLARVILAKAPSMDPRADTVDGVHLTTTGEILQARSVAAALAEVGMRSGPVSADPPDNGNLAPVPTVVASGKTVTVSWQEMDFATSEDIYIHNVTTGAWGLEPAYVGTSFSFSGVPGNTYEVIMAPVQHWAEVGTQSLPVAVTVPAD